MKLKVALLTIALVCIIVGSIFVTLNYVPSGKAEAPPFYVGIEFCYGNATECKALVDHVKNYTNLIVISSTNITNNEVTLNDTCDYIYQAGMHIVIYFPQSGSMYANGGVATYVWAMKAKDTYGDYFLGAYIYDEPGGKVLDSASGAVNINYVDYTSSNYFATIDYKIASNNFISNVQNKVNNYLYCAKKAGTEVMTADYGLYWFDYKAGYDVVLAEYGWGHDRQMTTALCRGAATAQNKDWGAIICWKDRTPEGAAIMENGTELYNDLKLAYDNGAKYAIVFDYAGDNKPNTTEHGILADEHFDALQNFWNYIKQNPDKHGSIKADTALVLPQSYGFGFRYTDDKIWGLNQADNWTLKIWNDTNSLLKEYGSRLDIVYNDPEFQESISSKYSKVVHWSSGATIEEYPVLNLNNTLGYTSIQKALSSGATLNGDTLYVKAGTYHENLFILKSISLVGESKETTIIDGGKIRSTLRISASGVNVTGFTIKNGDSTNVEPTSDPTAMLRQLMQQNGAEPEIIEALITELNSTGTDPYVVINQLTMQLSGTLANQDTIADAGIYLSNANNCTITGNTVTNSNYGILLSSSSNNTFRNNNLSDNKYGIGTIATDIAQYINDIDNSNTINSRPIYYLTNKKDLTIPSDAGYVALVNCTNITAQNLHLSDNYNGLLLINSHNSTITNNTITGNHEGLRISNASGNTLQDNNISGNKYNLNIDNILPNNIDSSNKVEGKPVYIWINQQDRAVPTDAGYVALLNCSGIVVQNLYLTNNTQGIQLFNTTNSIITQNTLTNMDCAIQLTLSSNNLVTQNTLTENQNGLKIGNASNNNIITDNALNTNTVSGITVSISKENMISNNTLTNNEHAIILSDSTYNTIKTNKIIENINGMQFTNEIGVYNYMQGSSCTNNTIIENNFTQNQNGIYLTETYRVANNTFYHNNFFNNTKHATTSSYSTSNSCIWDNGAEGNYWSSYNGTDNNGDGIGDTPMWVFEQYRPQTEYSPRYYSQPMPSDQDRYPMMQPFSPP